MAIKLVALGCTRPQVGKSTLASALVDALSAKGVETVVRPFADAVKSTLAHLLGLLGLGNEEIRDRLYGSRKEEIIPQLGVTARVLMVTFASNWGRDTIHKDLWVMIARSQVEKSLADGKFVIVDDLRMPNEYAMIKALNGLTIRIDRPQSETAARYDSDIALRDQQFDREFLNDGAMADLVQYASRLADEMIAV